MSKIFQRRLLRPAQGTSDPHELTADLIIADGSGVTEKAIANGPPAGGSHDPLILAATAELFGQFRQRSSQQRGGLLAFGDPTAVE